MRRSRRCRGRASITIGGIRPGRRTPRCGIASRASTISCAPIFIHKSADWKENKPHRLASWSAEELAKMPTYYIMDLADDMPAGVAKEMPSAAEIAACQWLPDRELAVYAGEYQRNGFQGGLNWYRSRSAARSSPSCSYSPADDRRAVDLHLRQE
jgi:hypothetical protein